MARKNRRANRNAAKTPEQEQQDAFIEEVADEDFNPDLDEEETTEEEGEDGFKESDVDGPGEGVAKPNREAEVVEATVPNVKTEEEEVKTPPTEVTSLGDEEDDGEEGDEAEKAVVTPEATEEEKAKEEEKTAPTAEELAAQAAEEAARAEATPPEPISNEQAAQLYTEWRGQTEELLATHHYALTQEQIEEFEENPAVFIPKAMSRVYMDSISAAFNQITNYLPQMVGAVIEQRESMNKAERAFFDKWPNLLDQRETVLRLGMSYRSANPDASMDDFINEVGAQAMVALRLTPDAAANTNGAGPGTQTPASKPMGFKPATETGAAAPVRTQPKNVFEELNQTLFEEDIDT